MKKIIISLCIASLLVSCSFGKAPPREPKADQGAKTLQNPPKTLQNPPKTNNIVTEWSIVTPSEPAGENVKIPLLVDAPDSRNSINNQLDIK